MSAGHKLIAVAVVLAGLLVAVAVWSGGESCDSWHKRSMRALTDPTVSAAEHSAVLAQRPKGCFR